MKSTLERYTYWIIGSMSNNSRKVTILAGFYKGLQSAGAAIIYRIDALRVPYMTIFGSTWGLCAAGLLIAAPVIWMKTTNHTNIEADLKFSGAAKEDVGVTTLESV